MEVYGMQDRRFHRGDGSEGKFRLRMVQCALGQEVAGVEGEARNAHQGEFALLLFAQEFLERAGGNIPRAGDGHVWMKGAQVSLQVHL